MATAITSAAPAGVAGAVSRNAHLLIENVVLDNTKTYKFGVPCKFAADGKVIPMESGDAATAFIGFLARSAPQLEASLTAAFNTSVVDANRVHGLMREGYMHVVCAQGTPVKGGKVYVRVTAASGKLVGDIEAAADGSNSVALTGVEFAVSGKDASNVTEIVIL